MRTKQGSLTTLVSAVGLLLQHVTEKKGEQRRAAIAIYITVRIKVGFISSYYFKSYNFSIK